VNLCCAAFDDNAKLLGGVFYNNLSFEGMTHSGDDRKSTATAAAAASQSDAHKNAGAETITIDLKTLKASVCLVLCFLFGTLCQQ